MTMDIRDTKVACYSTDCKFNTHTQDPEPSCIFKILCIRDGGQCTRYERIQS